MSLLLCDPGHRLTPHETPGGSYPPTGPGVNGAASRLLPCRASHAGNARPTSDNYRSTLPTPAIAVMLRHRTNVRQSFVY